MSSFFEGSLKTEVRRSMGWYLCWHHTWTAQRYACAEGNIQTGFQNSRYRTVGGCNKSIGSCNNTIMLGVRRHVENILYWKSV